LPGEHLPPIWRAYPNGTGVAAIAVDPVEGEFLLRRGWATLDGERWLVNLEGQNGKIDRDGRMALRLVRCEF
jgi:hypothetical protein